MRKRRFTEEQLLQALRQGETGTPVVETCRKLGITEQTFYRWRRKFGGLEASEVRELKSLFADLTLDKTILRYALG